MRRISLMTGLVALMVFGAISLRAEDEKKERGRGFMRMSIPFAMETIKEHLGEDLKMTADQEKKVQAINDEFAKKMEEANKKPEVVAAMEEMKKARESNNRDEMRAAFVKVREAMGFNSYEEYKTALSGALDEKQIAKLFPARGGRGGPGGGQKKTE